MLNQYLQDVASLLRDNNFLFNSKTQLTRYINKARDQVAIQTGCIQALIYGQAPFGTTSVPDTGTPGAAYPGTPIVQNFSTLVGVEKYSYGYALPFLKKTTQGVRGILDINDVAVSWGGTRPSLNWIPWEEMQAYARSYNIGVNSYPFLWSTLGSGSKGQVWLFPIPQITSGGLNVGQAGEMEWNTSCLPSALYNESDYEALPEPFTEAVKFYAAGLAFLGSQRYAMAQVMREEFNEQLGIDNAAVMRGRVPDYYWG